MGTAERTKYPSIFVLVLCWTPVSLFRTVTTQSGTTAPLPSCTVPEIVPPSLARAGAPQISNAHNITHSAVRRSTTSITMIHFFLAGTYDVKVSPSPKVVRPRELQVLF